MHGLEELLERKARLSSDISRQRGHLAQHVHALQPLFSGADRAVAVARLLRAHPGWVAAGAAMVMALFLRRGARTRASGTALATAMRWLRRGLFAWRTGSWALELLRSTRRP